MKKINIMLILGLLILFTGCSKNIFVDRSHTFMKIKVNKDFIKFKNIKYKELPKKNMCIKTLFNVSTEPFSNYGLLHIEHSELIDSCTRNTSISQLFERIVSRLGVESKYKVIEDKTIGDYTFYKFKIDKPFNYSSNVDKGPIFRFITIKGPNKGLTFIRDYFGIFYDELKSSLINNKPYESTKFIGKIDKDQTIRILKFDTVFVGIIQKEDKKDTFLGIIKKGNFLTTSSAKVNFQGTLLNSSIDASIIKDNGEKYQVILDSQGKTKNTLIDFFLETKGNITLDLNKKNTYTTSTITKFKRFKGTLAPIDTNGLSDIDLEILIFKDKCIAMIDFTHPDNKDIPIFIKTNCNIQGNTIQGLFGKTSNDIKSMGTPLAIYFEGIFNNNILNGSYESNINQKFPNKYFGTFYAKTVDATNVPNLNNNYQSFDDKGIHRGTRTKYNYNGFNKDGLHKVTKTKYTISGFDKFGYDKDGFDQSGFNQLNFDKNGFNKKGFDKNGFNKKGFDKNGYDINGIDKDGFDIEGIDKDNYNRNGFNNKDIHKITQNKYDEEGYSSRGYDKNGFNRSGIDIEGYNKQGYRVGGHEDGFNRKGIHKDTRNYYNHEGYNIKGYDIKNFNRYGFNKDTGTKYDKNGFDIEGYDINGFNKKGLDSKGFNKLGTHYKTNKKFDIGGYDVNGNYKK